MALSLVLMYIPDNGILMTELVNFSADDIQDLFKNFRDRMIARQYIKTQKMSLSDLDSSATSALEDNMSANSSIADTCNYENQNVSHGTGSLNDSLPTHCQYTAEQLLEKRHAKAKCNSAQAFFNNIMQDAALAAKLWKHPPSSLDVISNKKKDFFFKLIEETLPGVLTNKRNEVWRRLGQRLQNRRKYLKDKLMGKRKSKTTSTTDSETSSASIREAFLNPGDTVNIKNKRQIILGTGIFLGQKDQNYSEVAVKTLTLCSTSEDELPEKTVAGATNFKDVKEKTVITYWTKYISKKIKKTVRKRKASASNVTVSQSVGENVSDEESDSLSLESKHGEKNDDGIPKQKKRIVNTHEDKEKGNAARGANIKKTHNKPIRERKATFCTSFSGSEDLSEQESDSIECIEKGKSGEENSHKGSTKKRKVKTYTTHNTKVNEEELLDQDSDSSQLGSGKVDAEKRLMKKPKTKKTNRKGICEQRLKGRTNTL